MLIHGWNVVIGCCYGLLRTEHGETAVFKACKGNRTGHFVHEVTVDIKHSGTVVDLFNNMSVPDFVE